MLMKKNVIRGIVLLSLVGLVSSALALLDSIAYVWGCIASLGGILILSVKSLREERREK